MSKSKLNVDKPKLEETAKENQLADTTDTSYDIDDDDESDDDPDDESDDDDDDMKGLKGLKRTGLSKSVHSKAGSSRLGLSRLDLNQSKENALQPSLSELVDQVSVAHFVLFCSKASIMTK